MFQNNILNLLEWKLYHENVVGYESSQLGYESSGYETSMGTKRLDTGLPIKLSQFCRGNPPPASCRKHGVTTPLHLACSEGNYNLVSGLLSGGNQSDISTRNEQGSTPLHEAAFLGFQEIVALLLKHGADTKCKDDEGNFLKTVSNDPPLSY